MSNQYYRIQVFGMGTFGRARKARGLTLNIADVPLDRCVVISDEIRAQAIEALRSKKVRSGAFAIGAFRAREFDGMVTVSIAPSQQQSINPHLYQTGGVQ